MAYDPNVEDTMKQAFPDMLQRPHELHFTRTNGSTDRLIDELMDYVGGVHHPGIIREMILAALKAGQETGAKAHLKLMNSTLKEMRFTAKVFGPYAYAKKVTVFGSARVAPDHLLYRMAVDLGRHLVRSGFMAITGGGPGIMQAVNEGAGPDHSFGVNIRLPFEQKLNPVIDGNSKSITYKYFFNRKVAFIKEAHAVVLFPGGFGTLDEAMETLTLLQTGKACPVPLILIDAPGNTYWENWVKFIEKDLLARDYVSPEDMRLFDRVDSVERAVSIVRRFYSRYHSIRYVGSQLVIRMTSVIAPSRLKRLRDQFADLLLEGGKMVISGPLAAEEDQPETMRLPRLVLDFDRQHVGRLKHLIDAINA
jgi:uncharacterized protein (TIGR00730 family)